jgi:hypothetical protein
MGPRSDPLFRVRQVVNWRIRRNAGLCPHALAQLFGLGSEARNTNTSFPPPYVLEVARGTDWTVSGWRIP